MPSASGVYSLPLGYLAVTGATIQASQHNPPLEDIALALTGRLSRDGSAPMLGPLQLASGTVTLPGGVFATDPTSGFYKTTSGIGVAIGGQKVAEFLPGGVSGARFLGELFPYTGTAAPPLTVMPFGQTLSRTTYAALWTFAQTEIAAGNLLYNNGDGSTTFGIPDVRGRVIAGWDGMGGTPASRLTTTGGLNSIAIGGVGGTQTVTLLTANLPPYTPAGAATLSNGTIVAIFGGAGAPFTGNAGATWGQGTVGATFSGTPQGGTSTPVLNVQPTLVCNCCLFAGA